MKTCRLQALGTRVRGLIMGDSSVTVKGRHELARIAYCHGNRFPFHGLSRCRKGMFGKKYMKEIN